MFLHIDADAFFASVLQRQHPRLRGKPVLALGMSGGNVVIAASYEAKRKGVKTGMLLQDARKLVPDVIAMPSDFRATGMASRQLFTVLEEHCPGAVEKASIDEGYARIENEPLSFAISLQSDIHHRLDLPVSIGIARTKTLAKMGSKFRKPRGITMIHEADRWPFLEENLIDTIPGIGRRIAPKLMEQGIRTAADFARTPRGAINDLLGKNGRDLWDEVNGIPVFPLITEPLPPKSISRCRSFRPTADQSFLLAQVMTHLQYCIARLRRHGLVARGIGVWMRGRDYRRFSAERILGHRAAEEAIFLPFAKEAFIESIRISSPSSPPLVFSQTGLLLFDLTPDHSRQMSLFDDPVTIRHAETMQKTLDTIRKRFGRESIVFGLQENKKKQCDQTGR